MRTPTTNIEKRLTVLERELQKVKAELKSARQEPQPWWERFAGAFKNDPFFDKVIKAGHSYRRSLGPRSRA